MVTNGQNNEKHVEDNHHPKWIKTNLYKKRTRKPNTIFIKTKLSNRIQSTKQKNSNHRIITKTWDNYK